MSVTYSVEVRNDRLQAVIDNIDAGAGGGLLRIGTSGMSTVLATITLNKPCATIAAGVLTFSGLPLSDLADADGTAAEAEITDSAGTVVISGLTVGTSGADLIIAGTAVIATGDTVTLLTGTITGN